MIGGKLKPYKKVATHADYTPWATPKPVVPPCVFASELIKYLADGTVR